MISCREIVVVVRAEVGSEVEIPTDLEGLTDSFVHLVREVVYLRLDSLIFALIFTLRIPYYTFL